MEAVKAPLGLKVTNPLSQEQEYLRTSLRPGLLSILALNQRHQESLRFFEIGRVFLPQPGELPQEKETLAFVLAGARGEPSWQGKEGTTDFFQAKGLLQSLLGQLKAAADFRPANTPGLIPAQTAEVWVGDNLLGLVGQVHPQTAEVFDLHLPVFLAEMDLAALLSTSQERLTYTPLPRFPATVRDLALVMDETLPAERVQQVIAASPLVAQVSLFDHYTGAPIPHGKKSLAFSINYQSPQRTLTDAEVDEIQQQLLERLAQELGAVLR